MPVVGPTKRSGPVRGRRDPGFVGPHAGGEHQYMGHPDGRRIRIPHPHRGDIGTGVLLAVLREAAITRAEWERR